LIARQSLHAVRKPSAFFLSSNRSATSLTIVPVELDASEKREKKESMRASAVMEEDLYEEIKLRNLAMLDESFCRRMLACSITSRWRS
jgi:hypothetical protein